MNRSERDYAAVRPATSPGEDSAASALRSTSRKSVFFRVPSNWRFMTPDEKKRFADEAARAIPMGWDTMSEDEQDAFLEEAATAILEPK